MSKTAAPRSEIYSSLEPFRRWFQTGVPVLMYHKLGPRPPRVRLKGLYVSARLFERQLMELRAASFTPATMLEAARAQDNAAANIVLSFDDGFRNVLRHGIEPMARHGFRAIQFIVANLIGRTNEWEQQFGEAREPLMDAPELREWFAAGHEIGAHTLTHPFLTRIPPREMREEIFGSKKKLEDMFGRAVEHFCYPYGDWNPSVRDTVVEAGYRTACTVGYGVNTKTTPPFELNRIIARHQTRNLRTLKERFLAWAG